MRSWDVFGGDCEDVERAREVRYELGRPVLRRWLGLSACLKLRRQSVTSIDTPTTAFPSTLHHCTSCHDRADAFYRRCSPNKPAPQLNVPNPGAQVSSSRRRRRHAQKEHQLTVRQLMALCWPRGPSPGLREERVRELERWPGK